MEQAWNFQENHFVAQLVLTAGWGAFVSESEVGIYRSFLAAYEIGLSDVAGYMPGELHKRNQGVLSRRSTTCGEESFLMLSSRSRFHDARYPVA